MEYPNEYERVLTLTDGRAVSVRPIVPEYAELLQAEFDAADPETLYRRFMTPSPKIPTSRFRYLATVDYVYRFALVVFSPEGEGVAVARYEGHPTRTDAEVAVVVKPEWRQVGLASQLFDMLDERAAEMGIEHLSAVFLAENDAAAALMATSGFGSPKIEDGIVEVGKDIALSSR